VPLIQHPWELLPYMTASDRPTYFRPNTAFCDRF